MVLWDEEGSGYGDGYGYGEESGPIIEQTSSSLSHYEIMTLVRLLAFGLGVTGDEEDPFLLQIKENVEKVSKADVLRVAKKHLKPDKVQILAVGRPQDFGEPMSSLGTVRPGT